MHFGLLPSKLLVRLTSGFAEALKTPDRMMSNLDYAILATFEAAAIILVIGACLLCLPRWLAKKRKQRARDR